MKPNAMKTVMIRSAVEKGIKGIKDDPGRGIRNLVELGEMFAGGRFQKEFFETVLAQLKDENSAYYRVVDQVVHQVDTEALTSFGINLGYNALSHGANIIRGIEAEEGFNVPWCLVIDVGYDKILLPFDIEGVIEDGKELGIYSYAIYIDADYPEMEALLHTLHAEKECAFILFCSAKSINDTFCDALYRARNIAVFLDLDNGDDFLLQQVSARLQETGNVCGGFTRGDDLAADDIGLQLLTKAESLGFALLSFIRIKRHHPFGTDDVYKKFVELREHLEVPVLPIDLYEDMAHADKAISSEACLAGLMGDGTLTLIDVEQNRIVTDYSIHNVSLREALSKTMPKSQHNSKLG